MMKDALQPHQFKSCSGITFDLVITIRHYLELKRNHGVDIRSFMDENSELFRALTLQSDIEVVLKVIEVLLSDQLKKSGYSTDDLYDMLDPETFDQVGLALLEAIVNFMPAHQRPALRKALRGMDDGLVRASALLEGKAEELVVKELKQLDLQLQELKNSDSL